jgi:hypothetical protein
MPVCVGGNALEVPQRALSKRLTVIAIPTVSGSLRGRSGKFYSRETTIREKAKRVAEGVHSEFGFTEVKN